jgi:hypothetical protein
VNQDLIDRALVVATRMAADCGIEVGRDALMQALVAVAGEGNGQDEPEEITEEEALGYWARPSVAYSPGVGADHSNSSAGVELIAENGASETGGAGVRLRKSGGRQWHLNARKERIGRSRSCLTPFPTMSRVMANISGHRRNCSEGGSSDKTKLIKHS